MNTSAEGESPASEVEWLYGFIRKVTGPRPKTGARPSLWDYTAALDSWPLTKAVRNGIFTSGR